MPHTSRLERSDMTSPRFPAAEGQFFCPIDAWACWVSGRPQKWGEVMAWSLTTVCAEVFEMSARFALHGTDTTRGYSRTWRIRGMYWHWQSKTRRGLDAASRPHQNLHIAVYVLHWKRLNCSSMSFQYHATRDLGCSPNFIGAGKRPAEIMRHV